MALLTVSQHVKRTPPQPASSLLYPSPPAEQCTLVASPRLGAEHSEGGGGVSARGRRRRSHERGTWRVARALSLILYAYNVLSSSAVCGEPAAAAHARVVASSARTVYTSDKGLDIVRQCTWT